MAHVGRAESNRALAEAEVVDLGPRGAISTGICFLDHMIDQLTSHAQLGVTLCVTIVEPTDGSANTIRKLDPNQNYASDVVAQLHDRDIIVSSAEALGLALRHLADHTLGPEGKSGHGSAVFCCPLDEAFTEARLDLNPLPEGVGQCSVQLAPYGTYASGGNGRKWVGRLRTELTPLFWETLAAAMRIDLSLTKVRGANAHHVLEATFKAFARALRAALDPVVPIGYDLQTEPRRSLRQRATKETKIEVPFVRHTLLLPPI